METNIFITGDRKIGKTMLVLNILNQINVLYDGFITKPDMEYEIGSTYIMEDIFTKKSAPISRYVNGMIQGVPETFSNLGVHCLNRCLKSSSEIVVMDELGRFERECQDFINSVLTLLDSNKVIIAVLKAEPIAYLDQIKKRNDCDIYDLNQISYLEAYEGIISKLKILL